MFFIKIRQFIESKISPSVLEDKLLTQKTVNMTFGLLIGQFFLVIYSFYYYKIGLLSLSASSFATAILHFAIIFSLFKWGATKIVGNLAIVPGFLHILHSVYESNPLHNLAFPWLVAPSLCGMFFMGIGSGIMWIVITACVSFALFFMQFHSLFIFPNHVLGLEYNFIQVIGLVLFLWSLFMVYEFERAFSFKKMEEANKEINSQKLELEQINHSKDRIFSIVSHDLRGPLRNIKSILDLCEAGSITEEEKFFYLKSLQSTLDNTINVTDNLLKWSLMQQRNGIHVAKEKFPIKNVIENAINLCKSSATSKNIKIVNRSNGNILVLADPNMIEIVIRNLISNAIKFSYEGGMIIVETIVVNSEVVFSVIDFGVGVHQETKENLFKEYVTTPGTQKEKGTGFGLMLCKQFIEHNNGEIFLDTNFQKGTKISFVLPFEGISNREVINTHRTIFFKFKNQESLVNDNN